MEVSDSSSAYPWSGGVADHCFLALFSLHCTDHNSKDQCSEARMISKIIKDIWIAYLSNCPSILRVPDMPENSPRHASLQNP